MDGDLWIGGLNGVVRLAVRGLITYDVADGLKPNARILSVFEDRNGALLAMNDYGWTTMAGSAGSTTEDSNRFGLIFRATSYIIGGLTLHFWTTRESGGD